MTGKREAKRQDARARLIEAAQRRITAGGVKNLRARDVTADVGTALGGLYNAFVDLDDLILHVNSATLGRLRQAIETRLETAHNPRDALKALAVAYLHFARENHALWSALFDHRFAPERAVPDWHIVEQSELLTSIITPLDQLQPGLGETAMLLRARTLFGAFHGIVATSLEHRFVGIDGTDLEREILQFVDIIVDGMEASGHGG